MSQRQRKAQNQNAAMNAGINLICCVTEHIKSVQIKQRKSSRRKREENAQPDAADMLRPVIGFYVRSASSTATESL